MSWDSESFGTAWGSFDLPRFPELQPESLWESSKVAAVAIVFLPGSQHSQIILTRRSMNVGTHKGQMSFPGGFKEGDDRSPSETAVRELNEELGVSVGDVVVYGEMSPIVSKHGAKVVPVIMSAPWSVEDMRIQPDEVESVVLVDWVEFKRSKLKRKWLPRFMGPLKGYRVSSQDWVWGLTAEILRRLNLMDM